MQTPVDFAVISLLCLNFPVVTKKIKRIEGQWEKQTDGEKTQNKKIEQLFTFEKYFL